MQSTANAIAFIPFQEGNAMSVSDRILELRKAKGWNNVELAKAAGVTKQAVGTWINRDVEPGYWPLMQLREKHNINDRWILGLCDDMYLSAEANLDDDLKEVFLRLQESTDPDVKEQFLRVANALLSK